MAAKIKDAKLALEHLRARGADIRLKYMSLVNNNKFRMREIIRKTRKDIINTPDLRKKKKKNEHKKSHLKNLIDHVREGGRNNKLASPVIPDRLKEYKDLFVFGPPSRLPQPQNPVGPYLCHPNIKLSQK